VTQFEVTGYSACSKRAKRKRREVSLGTSGVPVEIKTKHLQNTNQKVSLRVSFLGRTGVLMYQ